MIQLKEAFGLAGKFIRRVRRYGLREAARKSVFFARQRLGLSTTGAYWDEFHRSKKTYRSHWLENPLVHKAFHERICPPPKEGRHHGLVTWLGRRHPGRVFARALSIGCGSGEREIELVKAGVVGRFDCFELGEKLVEAGRARARELGVQGAIEFRRADGFAAAASESYDLIHWAHSLHHMPDVDAALRKCRDFLKPEGVLIYEEYVGPNQLQWSDANLALVNGLRAELPEKYFVRPDFPEERFARTVRRPSRAEVERSDPTEALQSEKILAATCKYFPDVEVRMLGGAVSSLALEGIVANFDDGDARDRALIERVLAADLAAIDDPKIGSHYAAAMASKW